MVPPQRVELCSGGYEPLALAVMLKGQSCSLHTLRRALLLSRARGQPSPMVKPPCAALSLLSSHRSRYAVRRSEVPWPLQPRCSSDSVGSQACPCHPTPDGATHLSVTTQVTESRYHRLVMATEGLVTTLQSPVRLVFRPRKCETPQGASCVLVKPSGGMVLPRSVRLCRVKGERRCM